MTQSSSPDLGYWISRLQDKESCQFPTLIERAEGVKELQRINVSLPSLASVTDFCKARELRLSTIFQTAWGLVLRSYTGTEEVSFGYTTDSIHLLPCNLTLVRETSLKHALDSVEAGFTRDSNHIKCSLVDLEHALGLQEAGLFNTIVSCQNGSSHISSPEVNGVTTQVNRSETSIDDGDRDRKASSSRNMIEIDIKISKESISMQLIYKPSALSDGSAANVASALEMAIRCILDYTDLPVGEQNLFSPHHQRQVDKWNQSRPESINMTLHGAISARARIQLDAPAVHAWDEKWTYREVDELSTALAMHLVNLGVGVGMKIPLLFERSGWWVIALLAVSKAGAAFVRIISNSLKSLHRIYIHGGAPLHRRIRSRGKIARL